jgi:chromosome segregation ATPase
MNFFLPIDTYMKINTNEPNTKKNNTEQNNGSVSKINYPMRKDIIYNPHASPNQGAPKEVSQLYSIYSTASANAFKRALKISQEKNTREKNIEKLDVERSSAKKSAKNITQFTEEVAKFELEVSKLNKEIDEKKLKISQFENSEKVLNGIEKTMSGITITDNEGNTYNLLANYDNQNVTRRHGVHLLNKSNYCSATKPIVDGLQKIIQEMTTDSKEKFLGFSKNVENIVTSIQNEDENNPYRYNDFVNDFKKAKEEFNNLKEGIVKTKEELKNLESKKETAAEELNKSKGFLKKNQELHEGAKTEIQNIRSKIQNTYIDAFKKEIKEAIEKVGAKKLNASQSLSTVRKNIIADMENMSQKLANKILIISKTPTAQKEGQRKLIMENVKDFIDTEISTMIDNKIKFTRFEPMRFKPTDEDEKRGRAKLQKRGGLGA